MAITVERIREFRFSQEKEDYTIDDLSAMDVDIDPELVGRAYPEAQLSKQRSNLRLFPPPIFSRQGIPQNYKCVTLSQLLAFVHFGGWCRCSVSVSNRTRCPSLLLS
jgi:hypothetical protein